MREMMDRFDAGAYEGYVDLLGEHMRDWFAEHFRTKDAEFHRGHRPAR